MSLGKNDCILASGPTEDFYEYLGALFSDLKPGDGGVVLLYADSVSIIEPVEDAAVTETITYRPDIKTRKTVGKSGISLETEAENMKKAVVGRKVGRFLGLDGIVIGRANAEGATKCGDHG